MKKSTILLALLGAMTVGCRVLPTTRDIEFHGLMSTNLYVEEPRDLTHGGVLVQGSGSLFLGYLRTWFSSSYGAGVVVHSISPGEVAPQYIDIEGAFARAEESGCEYMLAITLGEMRDAAPMTFRSDYATLQEAVLYRVADRKEMWRSFPYRVEKGNIGSYLPLLNNLAKRVVISLTRIN